MLKMSDNVKNVIVIITLSVCAVEITQTTLNYHNAKHTDINNNIATCIESKGDPYLCCIHHGENKKKCLDKETSRKLRQPR